MDLLAQVSVENDAAAESLDGETLPGSRKTSSVSASTVSLHFLPGGGGQSKGDFGRLRCREMCLHGVQLQRRLQNKWRAAEDGGVMETTAHTHVYWRKACGKNGASLNLQRCCEASLDTRKWKINVNVKSKQINGG